MAQVENSNTVCNEETNKESRVNNHFPQYPNNEMDAFFVRNVQTIWSALALLGESKSC